MRGERLKKLRIERNLNQKELAKILKVSQSAIGMYEINQREPDDDMKFKIAELFNTTVAYLMGETDDRNKVEKDDNFVAFYEGYKDLDEEDKEIIKATIKALKKKGKKN